MSNLSMKLVQINNVFGIYGKNKDEFPKRAAKMHMDAGYKLMTNGLLNYIVVSDMLRSPESSLSAVKRGKGALPPGRSAHNFGLAIDIDIKRTMINAALKTKKDLDAFMADCDFICHRTDGKMESEAWHYNYIPSLLVTEFKSRGIVRPSAMVEEYIRALYSSSWAEYDTAKFQIALRTMGYYSGEIDGDYGPLTRQGLNAFQRAWMKRESATIDDSDRRLMYVVHGHRNMGAL